MSSLPTAQKCPDPGATPTDISDSAEIPGRYEVATAFAIAFALSITFYAYSLAVGSRYAGFVYTGDFWHACLAHLAKLHALASHGVFSGIDYSTHGGASEFFLRPNLYPYHPLALLASVFLRLPTPESLVRLSVLMLFAHSLAGCYYAIRLARRYLHFTMGLAVFTAAGYVFSLQMVNALGYPPYLFCAALLPWAVYAALKIADQPSLLGLIRASLPVFVMFTAGYVALGVSCIVLAYGFIAVFIVYVDRANVPRPAILRRLALSASPFALASLVVAPLYLAIVRFHQTVPTAITNVTWSAYLLAEAPRTVLRLLASRVRYEGPFFEFSLYWGVIPIIIGLTFFAGMKDHDDLSNREWRLFKFSATTYLLIVLAMYGDFSAASNLLYAVPGIGKMHIYQRHLLAGQLFFILATALMLKAVAARPVTLSKRAPLFVAMALLAFAARVLVTNGAEAARLHINDYFVFDLMLAAIYAAIQIVPGRTFTYVAASFLMLLIPLDHIYDYSTRPQWAYPEQQKALLELDKTTSDRLSHYFRANSRKAIIKYVDVTTGLRDYLSKNHPWFVAQDVALSSYNGYEMQLAAKAPYLDRMVTRLAPGSDETWIMRPDWSWVARTGGEFIVYQEGDRWLDFRAKDFADLRDPGKVLRLPNRIVVAPLNFDRLTQRFSAGNVKGRYIRVQLAGEGILSLAEVRVRGAAGRLLDLSSGKAVSQSSTLDGSSHAAAAAHAIDGNTDGDWRSNSITHTNVDSKAWWQVDLGAPETVTSVEIWNRTDCCGDRLGDYWVFVSDSPFSPSDTPASLSTRPDVVANHQQNAPYPVVTLFAQGARTEEASLPAAFDNGYVRAFGEGAVTKFSTDGASSMVLDVDAKGPVKIEYLFWPNERLKFYVEGTAVPAKIEQGLQTLSLGPGRHRVQIQYVNWPLRLFLVMYCCYGMAMVFAIIWPLRSLTQRFRSLSRAASGGGWISNLKWYTQRMWR